MASEFVRWICVDVQGEATEVTAATAPTSPALSSDTEQAALFRAFVLGELGVRRPGVTGESPAHIRYMRRHELVDYCDVSEPGHLKWYPRGVLIHQLLMDEARRLAREWGALEMRNPILIRSDSNDVGELMGEFHERDYRVDGGRGVGYLRYASDPLAFPFMRGVRYTERQAPLRVYEEANCFRNEQDGEVSGLRRVRAFAMTDMHAACSSAEQAYGEFEALSLRFGRLVRSLIARDRWVLGWEGTVEFYEQNRAWLHGLGVSLGVPAFFKLMPRMSHYYAMKNEFQSITADGVSVQLSTVQWDVKDGERFGIGHVDGDGRTVPAPVIIHASSFGSIERSLCALLENVAVDDRAGLPATLPYWLAPTQVRLLPVAERHVEACLELAGVLERAGARCDVDDREERVGWKIRSAEQDWVPFAIVVGDLEANGAPLSVRMRRERATERLPLEALAGRLREEQGGLAWRPLPTCTRLSRNPVFHG